MAFRFLLFNLLFFIGLGTYNQSFAQKRKCYTHEHNQALLSKDPDFNSNFKKLKALPSTYRLNANSNNLKTSAGPVVIPVVVHVVYNTAIQNISEDQILSQIQILNQDFSRTNPDASNTPALFSGIAANTDIQFCLAKRDPNGNPTTGITRTYSATSEFILDDPFESIKRSVSGGKDIWNRDQYLNIWVCNLEQDYLGYAQFPGGDNATDGVVIGYKYFGTGGVTQSPYNGGRTVTHEVGHWLGLFHIWGDDTDCSGTDEIADTPNQEIENYGCPSYPSSSCANTSDMFMNYMDYTNDACMNMFTVGQSTKMNNAISTYRNALGSSLGCTAPTNSICSGQNTTLTAPFGRLIDGSLTANYENNSECSWLIQPSGASYVTIDFIDFNTELTNDTLVFYDGIDNTAPILGTFSGTSTNSITSTTGSIFIIFKTNSSSTNQGWTFLWESDGNTVSPSCSGLQTFTASSGTVTDGSGIDYYGPNKNCTFLIQPTIPGNIYLTFTEFDTEKDYDYVYVYKGNNRFAPLIGIYSGQSIPPMRFSDAGAMFIEFETDDFINGGGWSATYSDILPTTNSTTSDIFFKAYPNPANQTLTIESTINSLEPVTLYLLNPLGQRIIRKEITSGSIHETIDIENFPEGLYKVILEQNDQQYSKSIMKLK